MRLFIEPLDVLFFRDGRPFVAGEAHMAQSLFPPTALTFQGALRTAVLAAAGIDPQRYATAQKTGGDAETQVLIEEIGDSESFGRLRMRGPFVAVLPTQQETTRNVEEWYPCPADLVTERKRDGGALLRLQPCEGVPWISDVPLGMRTPWVVSPARMEAARGFIAQEGLQRYLDGGIPEDVCPDTAFVLREQRMGIALASPKKVADEGKLYTIEMLRLRTTAARRTGFTIDVEGTTRVPEQGILALGGERRTAVYERVAERVFPRARGLAEMIDRTHQFLVYLAAPAIFLREPRWLPDFIDRDSLLGTREAATIRVVSAVVGRPVPIGGWDLANNRPKPMQPAVPAGSVYWCEVVSGHGEAVVQAFHGQCMSSLYAEIGFGLSFVGRWPHV
jgi:CRISPR-associated protein Cmr3